MLHYHGTPITPRAQLLKMGGRNFCVSFAAPQDLSVCLAIGQSVMFDNGAFSAHTRGKSLREEDFYRWAAPVLRPPHWLVIPDKIGGDVREQCAMLSRFPRNEIDERCICAVWHLDKPFSFLHSLINQYPKVALGSAGAYWEVGSEKWTARMDAVFNEIERVHKRMPWIHGMRMLAQAGKRWPLASADSTNVARNFKREIKCAECMAARIDAVNPVASAWSETPALVSSSLFESSTRSRKR